MLRTRGHDDVFDRRFDSLERHQLANLVAQLEVALAARVLNGKVAARAHRLFEGLGDQLFGKRVNVGHATGKRNDFWAANHRKQRSHFANR